MASTSGGGGVGETFIEGHRLNVGPKELMCLCEQCYAELDVGKTSVDSHTEDFLKRNRVLPAAGQPGDEDVATFVEQVVYGTVRYKKLIMVLLTAFYDKHSGQILRFVTHCPSLFLSTTGTHMMHMRITRNSTIQRHEEESVSPSVRCVHTCTAQVPGMQCIVMHVCAAHRMYVCGR